MSLLIKLSNKIGFDLFFSFRRIDANVLSSLNAFQKPCHIVAKCTHDLETFLILTNFVRGVTMNHGPVISGNYRHLMISEIFSQNIQSCSCAGTSCGSNSCGWMQDFEPFCQFCLLLRYCTVFQVTRLPCSSALFRLHSLLSLEAIKCTALFSICFHKLLRYYGCVGLSATHLDS